MKGVASFWKSLSCFSISHLRHRFCLVSSSSLFLIPFHSGMSGTHMGHSGDQGLLLIFVWCCGRTIVHVEVLFVIHSLRELHFTSTYISAFLELLSFSWQRSNNSFLLDRKTWNISCHELICLMGLCLRSHVTGTTLTSNMQSSILCCHFFFCPLGNFS